MTAQKKLPTLAIASLGGTVSMKSDSLARGVKPALGCEMQVAQVPELRTMALLIVETLALLPSASLSFSSLLEVFAWAKSQVEAGAVAIVMTQGTDSLEETAYFLDLIWPFDAPVVMTGAMRSASQPGHDGPANLLAAAQVALADDSRGRGVLVVMGDQVHAASRVRKTASLSASAFNSPGYGPLGVLIEGAVLYHHDIKRTEALPLPIRDDHRVALLESCLGADVDLLLAVKELKYEGLVIAGFGAGHVSESWSAALGRIAPMLPVIVATRTGSGSTARGSYGFVGGEIDLQAKGIHMAGRLCPRKCRILLWLLCASNNQHRLESWLE
ncbi:asparaginase [Pseudomonas fulva]|uniref:asparaginase n=1 Tax=Pseudomonas fulva TaxID=47880 RepID=UPI0014288D32|nr:asparaginase [Pseudomonas fulva]NIX94318.1 asparaginase [Pseudomonas fulva]